jgi:FKBP-type peptidyl-prolyl cis-trans isomerase FklB
MHKFTTAIITLTAAMLFSGSATAQQANQSTTQAPAQGAPTQPSTPKSQAPATKSATKSTSTSKTAAPLTLKTPKEKFSYAIGLKMGENFKRQSVEVDPAILARGVKDALAGNKGLLTDEEAQSAIMDTQKEVRARMEEKNKEAGAANKKEGDAFLEANKSKEGVKVLPSGLQYKILKEGTGPKPAASDSVSVNYRGTLINGKEFDSSYKRGQPATFPVSRVIPGWTEALQLMPVGSKWELFIPSDLAYGEHNPPGGDIGPDETLIFEVELLSIENKDKDKDKNAGQEPEKK